MWSMAHCTFIERDRICLPFGPWSLFFILIGIISGINSIVGSFSCSFFRYTSGAPPGFPSDIVGLWTYEISSTTCGSYSCNTEYNCYGYPKSFPYFDTPWKTGRAFSMISGLISIFVVLILFGFFCIPWPPKMFLVTACLAAIAGSFQLISLVSAW